MPDSGALKVKEATPLQKVSLHGAALGRRRLNGSVVPTNKSVELVLSPAGVAGPKQVLRAGADGGSDSSA